MHVQYFFTGTFLEWFLPKEHIKNRKGKWFLAIGSLKEGLNSSEVIQTNEPCQKSQLAKDSLTWTFPITSYFLHVYSGGAYCFNESTDEWTGQGLTVSTYTSASIKIGINKFYYF